MDRIVSLGGLVLLISAVVLGAFVGRWLWAGTEVAAAYSAKILCSCVFLSERDPAACRREELARFGFVTTRVDRDAHRVEARVWRLSPVHAEYHEGLGCTTR